MTCLHISGTHIIDNGIAKHIVKCVFLLYILCLFADDNSQLRLIVQAVHQSRVRGNTASVRCGLIHTLGKIHCVGEWGRT